MVSSPTPYVSVPEAVSQLQEAFLTQTQEHERSGLLLQIGRLGNQREGDVFPYRDVVGRTLVELFNLSVWWPEKRSILRAMGECRGSEVIFRYLLRTLDTVGLQLDGGGPEMVTAIIDALGRLGLSAAGPVLLRRYLTPEVPEVVRLQALEVLGHLGFSEAVPHLLDALEEEGGGRIVAIYALTELVSAAGVGRVEQILEKAWRGGELEGDHDRDLVRAAVTYLCSLGVEGAEAWVMQLLYTHEPDLRSLALWGRRIRRDNASKDLLDRMTAALEEDDAYVRAFLGRSLRMEDAGEVIETGEVFCETTQGQVRLIHILAEVGGPKVSAWLWERFIEGGDGAERARAAAIQALRSVREDEGKRLLKMASVAPDMVAVAAIRAAANFGPLGLLPGIVDLFNHDRALLRQEAVRAIQHLLLAHRPSHVSLLENKGESRQHRPADLSVTEASLELVDAGFRKILRRDDDGMTQGLVAYAAANLRRFELWPRVLKLAEKSPDVFARLAAYHALLDMPDDEQVERLMAAFEKEKDRAARSACIRTLAPLLASLPKPNATWEQALASTISDAQDDADEFELTIYAHALGLMRAIDPLPLLDRIAARGGRRSSLEVISALGKLKRVGTPELLVRLDEALAHGPTDARIRSVDALAALNVREATDRLLELLRSSEQGPVRERAVRLLASLGRSRRGLSFSSDRLDTALERVGLLLREEQGPDPVIQQRTIQEDLMDLKLALWQATSTGGVDDERVDRVISEQLGAGLAALSRHGEESEEVLRALRGAEFFHLQSREMPPSADLSPAILSYTKGIELWLHVRLTELLPNLRDVARDNYQTIMDTWDAYEVLLRSLVTIPVKDANRAVDWTKVPRVAKAMKEKKFTADWRTLSISNSGAIVIFYGVDQPEFGATNALGLAGPPEAILSVAVNALALAALRNAMAHEQSASRQDLQACRDLAYDIMRGIAAWG